MKCYTKILALLLTMIAVPFACSSVPKFADIVDKDWRLIEVRNSTENITFDRNKLEEEGFSDFFTMRFDKERVNGVGAPNRYFAPYTQTDNKQEISIKPIAQTQMAALFEPEELKEHVFFFYLQNTKRWNIAGGNLELHSKGEDGTETILVFAQ